MAKIIYILNLLKEINDHYANLLILGVGLFALIYAVREYRTKNFPVFAPKVDLNHRDNGTFVNITFENRCNHPIKIEVVEVSVNTYFGNFSTDVENYRVLQEGQKDFFCAHYFDRSQIEHLELPPAGERQPKPAVLCLRALGHSIVDRGKKLECVVEVSILFCHGKKTEVTMKKYDLRTV